MTCPEKDDPITKVTLSGPALLSAADEAAVDFLSLAAFEESLLYQILFGNGLLLHEAYFYDSSLLLQHVKNNPRGDSLFEVAAKSGLVIPAYRDRHTQSLRDAHSVLLKAYAGEGTPIPDKLKSEHLRMISAVDAGVSLPGRAPVYWPDLGSRGVNSLGSSYERIVRNLLSKPKPPIRESDSPDRRQLMERAWARSREWRTTCVDIACEQTEKKKEFGLQRYELHRAVNTSLGIKNLLPYQKLVELTKAHDGEKALALDLFFRWTTHCHWMNLADRFGSKTSFPRYDLDTDFIADTIVLHDSGKPSKKSFQCQVNLPSYEALSRISPEHLVAVRMNTGQAYQKELHKAAIDPNANETGIQESLAEYCEAIGRCAKDDVMYKAQADYFLASGTLSDTVCKVSSATAGFGLAAAKVAGASAASVATAGVFVAGTVGLLVIYPLIREQLRKGAHKKNVERRSATVEFSVDPPKFEKS